jgi:hypothetical protein
VPELAFVVREELRLAGTLRGRPVEVDAGSESRRGHRHRQLPWQAGAGGGDGALPGGVGLGPVQHRQVERELRLLGQAQVLADEVAQRAAQGHRAGRLRGRCHRHRQQHRVLVAVGHHRRRGHLRRVRPLDGAGGEAGRQLPVDARRLAGIAGVLPVDVPAAVEFELHADCERLLRQHAAHVGEQRDAGVRRLLGQRERWQQQAEQREPGAEQSAHHAITTDFWRHCARPALGPNLWRAGLWPEHRPAQPGSYGNVVRGRRW